MTTLQDQNVVSLLQNGDLFYVVDEHSKHIFEDQLGLPFYSFGIDQKDCVSGMLKRAKIKVKLMQSQKVVRDLVSPVLDDWVKAQPFKNPIKKKYEVSEDFSLVRFDHLGPHAKTIAQKAAAVSKCQDSLHPFVLRLWEQVESHFYRVMVFDSTVETEAHRSGTIIRISYPIKFQAQFSCDSEDEDGSDES